MSRISLQIMYIIYITVFIAYTYYLYHVEFIFYEQKNLMQKWLLVIEQVDTEVIRNSSLNSKHALKSIMT